VPDSDPKSEALAEINREFSELWPNITRKKAAPADADSWKDVPDKYATHFSPAPGGKN
jgi:ferredoxin